VIRHGIFGGTFDPIHTGHLDVALAAHRALDLGRVTLVPSNVPPHRDPPRASAAHRFAMVALAIQGHDELSVSDLEMSTGGPSYTAGTLDRLAARGLDLTSIVLVTGADAFREIETWKGYPEILDRCHFVVVSRPNTSAPSLRGRLPSLADRMVDVPTGVPARPAILLVDAPTAPVSSTDVRRRLEWGKPIKGLVPDAVDRYIRQHRLYVSSGAVGRNDAL
jgi:nicotinate-nucleotide adenylyltransferase